MLTVWPGISVMNLYHAVDQAFLWAPARAWESILDGVDLPGCAGGPILGGSGPRVGHVGPQDVQ